MSASPSFTSKIIQPEIKLFEHHSHYDLELIERALTEFVASRPCPAVRNHVARLQAEIRKQKREIEDEWREKSVYHGSEEDEEDEGPLHED